MKKNKYHIMLAVFGGTLILVLGGLYMAYSVFSQTGLRVYQLKANHERELQKISITQEMIANTNILQDDIESVQNRVLIPDGEVVFIDTLEKIARAQDLVVEVDSVAVSDTDVLTAASLDSLEIRITVTGEWSRVYSFLKKIEALPYAVRVKVAEFANTSDPATKGQVIWQGTFNISVLKKK